jgi:hypothetical protein
VPTFPPGSWAIDGADAVTSSSDIQTALDIGRLTIERFPLERFTIERVMPHLTNVSC